MPGCFHDSDPAIRSARETARKYLRQIKLRNPSLNGTPFPPRDLAETLQQEEVIAPDTDEAMEKAADDAETKAPPDVAARDYDPQREKNENEALENSIRRAENADRLKGVFNALMLLADESVPALDEAMVKAEIVPLLQEAPRWVAQALQDASGESISSRKNYFEDDEKIARLINSKRYPNLDDPQSAEFTWADHKDTKALLCYVWERDSVIEVAVGNLLEAVQKVNKAFGAERPL